MAVHKTQFENSMLVQKHFRLTKDNLLFLDEYVNSHEKITSQSEAIRDIIYKQTSDDRRNNVKLNAMSKTNSLILELFKLSVDEDTYQLAVKNVEDLIQKNVTKSSSIKNEPKTRTSFLKRQIHRDRSEVNEYTRHYIDFKVHIA